ncbi:unnamed protein product, partial [Meganyctiphanes norvegica]
FQDQTHFLHKTFRDIECYLMPRPGDCVTSNTYNGCHKEMQAVFKEKLSDLTKKLFDHQHMEQNLKKVNGKYITAGEFCKYFEHCTRLMTNKGWKQPLNMLEVGIFTQMIYISMWYFMIYRT